MGRLAIGPSAGRLAIGEALPSKSKPEMASWHRKSTAGKRLGILLIYHKQQADNINAARRWIKLPFVPRLTGTSARGRIGYTRLPACYQPAVDVPRDGVPAENRV